MRSRLDHFTYAPFSIRVRSMHPHRVHRDVACVVALKLSQALPCTRMHCSVAYWLRSSSGRFKGNVQQPTVSVDVLDGSNSLLASLLQSDHDLSGSSVSVRCVFECVGSCVVCGLCVVRCVFECVLCA